MKRKGILSVLLGGALILSVTGCSDDDATCGDGKAEGSEQCDLTDLKGNTCLDLGYSGGSLACTAQCAFDTSGCCGDGQLGFGEQCDCGDNPADLPDGCTDVNGGTDANCDDQCMKIAYCGDGVRDTPDEECDCGMDADWQPASCDAPNSDTDPEATCDADCNLIEICQEPGADGSCDWSYSDHCCDDEWGAEVLCVSGTTDGFCARACDASLDCYWNSYCRMEADPYCSPAFCGGSTGGWPGEINDFCTVSGTTDATGWCMAYFREEYQGSFIELGLCVEYDGTGDGLGPGEECRFDTGGEIDRADPTCSMGACFGRQGDQFGHCAALCSWEEAYAKHILGLGSEKMPCPADTNCFSDAEIDQTTGIRGPDSGHCEADYLNDLRTCDVISGMLMRQDTGEVYCSDLGAGYACSVYYDGTLIGVCEETTPDLNVWDACGSGGTCPVGTECAPTDVFGSATNAARCIPLCDTARHTTGQDCLDLGAQEVSGATPICTSQSALYIPGGGQIDGGHGSPSRLGYCALPPD